MAEEEYEKIIPRTLLRALVRSTRQTCDRRGIECTQGEIKKTLSKQIDKSLQAISVHPHRYASCINYNCVRAETERILDEAVAKISNEEDEIEAKVIQLQQAAQAEEMEWEAETSTSSEESRGEEESKRGAKSEPEEGEEPEEPEEGEEK